jgi:hypothetical protein
VPRTVSSGIATGTGTVRAIAAVSAVTSTIVTEGRFSPSPKSTASGEPL